MTLRRRRSAPCRQADHLQGHAAEGAVGIRDSELKRFVERLRARLAAGAKTYGGGSFTRPAAELVDEIQQELEDVCGWSLILWIRLDALRTRVDSLRKLGGDCG